MIRNRWTRLVLVACFAAFVTGAQAQVNPESCGEIRDPDTEFQMNLCTAHVGCSFVFKIQKVCAKAKGFLDKLRDTLTGRQEITNNDVFEAAAPEARPVPALTRYIDAAREAVRSTFNDPANRQKWDGKARNGTPLYYEGGLNNGNWEGAGISINESGLMSRGKMKDGRLNGDGQIVRPDGNILAGHYQDHRLHGPAARQFPDGTVWTGIATNGPFTGFVTSTQPDGSSRIVHLDSQGNFVAAGPLAPPGQKPVPPTVASVQPKPVPAAATPAPQPAPAPSASVSAPAPGTSNCRPDEGLLQKFVEASRDAVRLINWGTAATMESARADWYQRLKTDMGGSIGRKDDIIEMRRKERITHNWDNDANPLRRQISLQSHMQLLRLECLVAEARATAASGGARSGQAASTQVAAAGSASPGAGGTFSGTCKSAYDRQEAHFHDIDRRAPRSSDSIPPLQTALYMTSQRMALLNQLCRGQPQYAEYSTMQQQHAQALRACLSVASSSHYCNANPSRPGW